MNIRHIHWLICSLILLAVNKPDAAPYAFYDNVYFLSAMENYTANDNIPVNKPKTVDLSAGGGISDPVTVTVSATNPQLQDILCASNRGEFQGRTAWTISKPGEGATYAFVMINVPTFDQSSRRGVITDANGNQYNWGGPYVRLTNVTAPGLSFQKVSSAGDYAEFFGGGMAIYGAKIEDPGFQDSTPYWSRGGYVTCTKGQHTAAPRASVYKKEILRNLQLTFQFTGTPPAGTFTITPKIAVFFMDAFVGDHGDKGEITAYGKDYMRKIGQELIIPKVFSPGRGQSLFSIEDRVFSRYFSYVPITITVPAVCGVQMAGNKSLTLDHGQLVAGAIGIGGSVESKDFVVSCNTPFNRTTPLLQPSKNEAKKVVSQPQMDRNAGRSTMELALCKNDPEGNMLTTTLTTERVSSLTDTYSYNTRTDNINVNFFRHTYRVSSQLNEKNPQGVASNCAGDNDAKALIYIDIQ